MKTYHVTIGWKLTAKDPATWEETFALAARSKKEAAVTAGFALARMATSARVVSIEYVTVEKAKVSLDPIRIRANQVRGDG